MTKLIHREGDIFTTQARGIGHGCNVQGVMGAGIAKQFRDRFPVMYKEYVGICGTGQFQPGSTLIWEVRPDLTDMPRLFIYNVASQDRPGPNAEYKWLITGVQKMLQHAEEMGLDTVAIPRIGSGIGGLHENLVEGALMVLAELSPVDIELWTYKT